MTIWGACWRKSCADGQVRWISCAYGIFPESVLAKELCGGPSVVDLLCLRHIPGMRAGARVVRRARCGGSLVPMASVCPEIAIQQSNTHVTPLGV